MLFLTARLLVVKFWGNQSIKADFRPCRGSISLTLELFKSQLYLLFCELDFIGDKICYTKKLNSSLTQLSDGGAGIPAQEIRSCSLMFQQVYCSSMKRNKMKIKRERCRSSHFVKAGHCREIQPEHFAIYEASRR